MAPQPPHSDKEMRAAIAVLQQRNAAVDARLLQLDDMFSEIAKILKENKHTLNLIIQRAAKPGPNGDHGDKGDRGSPGAIGKTGGTGQRGATGGKGQDGARGNNGSNGKDGRGIKSLDYDKKTGKLTVTYTDGTKSLVGIIAVVSVEFVEDGKSLKRIDDILSGSTIVQPIERLLEK